MVCARRPNTYFVFGRICGTRPGHAKYARNEYASGQSFTIIISTDADEYAGNADAASQAFTRRSTRRISTDADEHAGNEHAGAASESLARRDAEHAAHGQYAGNGVNEHGSADGDDGERYGRSRRFQRYEHHLDGRDGVRYFMAAIIRADAHALQN